MARPRRMSEVRAAAHGKPASIPWTSHRTNRVTIGGRIVRHDEAAMARAVAFRWAAAGCMRDVTSFGTVKSCGLFTAHGVGPLWPTLHAREKLRAKRPNR